jgi:succinate dehydrogenase / fumarate reductase cytochrome b subunit
VEDHTKLSLLTFGYRKRQCTTVSHGIPPVTFVFPKWYRFQITSALSILHRISGIVLLQSSIMIAWWLVAVESGGQHFASTHVLIISPIGRLLLFFWSLTFFYHLCNGTRHLAWDAGYGFEIRNAYLSGYGVLAATVLPTVLAWLYVLLA